MSYVFTSPHCWGYDLPQIVVKRDVWFHISINSSPINKVTYPILQLVGGLEHVFYVFLFFHSVGDFIIPTDVFIFSEGRYTTNQSSCGSPWDRRESIALVDWKLTVCLMGT